MSDEQHEASARVRAARAYAGLDQAALAQHLGISVATVRRLESGGKRLGPEEARIVVDVTGVPQEWFDETFSVPAAAIERVDRRLQALDAKVDEVVARLERIETRDR